MDVNDSCPRCAASRGRWVRDGFYSRADDSKRIQRWQCKDCAKKFSSATFKHTYRQKKRRINATVRFGLGSNMCQRDIAELVGVNVKTIASRLVWQAALSREKNKRYLAAFIDQHGPIKCVQFDDLVTIEHTKCKPLTVPVAIVDGKRVPLGFAVAAIPANGHLAAISRQRYGYRKDHSRTARDGVIKQLKTVLPEDIHFKTDGHDHYKTLIKKHFPMATHSVFKSEKGCVVGQGELKKTKFDPLFSVNHSFATMRAKINRLNRRTWCTTKLPERLADHIDIFIDVFSDRLKLLDLSVRTNQKVVFDGGPLS